LDLLLFGGIVITSEIDLSQFFCWNEDCPDYRIRSCPWATENREQKNQSTFFPNAGDYSSFIIDQ